MSELIFQTSPIVTIATNKFFNVPVILKFEEINLIEIVKHENLGYTTQIPIYHSDGTYLAKVNGTRLFLTNDGKKAQLKLDKLKNITILKLENQILFEIKHGEGDSFKTQAELYTPNGYFVKIKDAPTPQVIDQSGESLKIYGNIFSDNKFIDCKVGIWIRDDGYMALGVK